MRIRIKSSITPGKKSRVIEDAMKAKCDSYADIIVRLSRSNSQQSISRICKRTPIIAILKNSMTENEAIRIIGYIKLDWFESVTAKMIAASIIDHGYEKQYLTGVPPEDVATEMIELNDPQISGGKIYCHGIYLLKLLKNLAEDNPDSKCWEITRLYELGLQ